MVDVYRRTTAGEPQLARYTLSVMFFPHLVAGPILRPNDFLTRLGPGQLPDRTEAPLEATLLLARGFFKKMVLADRLALAIDPFFTHVTDSTTAGVWALPFVYLYALQIYFDFSGYTDIARGLGLLFGFRWPDNFNRPYLATSMQEFWARWHMTLSLFLRDYLYIPLGGNRRGWWRTQINLMLTMLLGGLWHGASWSFLLWGGLHGSFLIAHRAWTALPGTAWLRERGGWLWRLVATALTFHCVCLAWCFFRLTDFRAALVCVSRWFTYESGKAFAGGSADLSIWTLLGLYGLVAVATIVWHQLPPLAELAPKTRHRPLTRGLLWGFAVVLLLLAVLLSPGGEAPPFIYFQF
jgi:D-alanyl-lipoteichoic acid acyltransferase DltB (MBOAT superfamily)